MSIPSSEHVPGVPVEVRTRFTAHWAPGFEIVQVVGDRARVRRSSDGAVLPVALSVDDIRRPTAGLDGQPL